MPLPLVGVALGAVARGALTAGRFGLRGDLFGGGATAPLDAPGGVQTKVSIEGLGALRRDFRAIGAGLNRELNAELREAASVAARDAGALAPRRTGALARSYKPFVRGNKVGIRSPLPYAAVHEWGGTIRPRGAPISIQRSAPVSRAVERNADRIIEDIGDRIEALAKRNGFH